MSMFRFRILLAAAAAALLAGCAVVPGTGTPPSSSEPLPLADESPVASEPLVEPEPTAPADIATRSNPLVDRALSALGTRYRYGGSSLQSGFDCSGFVRWIYQDIAAQLPRSAQALSQVDAPVIERDQLQAGDLLFFRINRSRSVSHVGMYVGNGEFIHSPSSGGRVRVESMETPYWRARFVKARRWTIPTPAPMPGPAAKAG